MPFPARADYETLLYNLLQQYGDHIAVSTVHLYSTSALTARVTGSIQFANGLELRVAEFVDFVGGRIRDYSYAVYLGAEKVRWYDPQPHPDNVALAPTFPHHYHTPPDIKHNRQPAPGISFDAPNLPTLIHDCIELGKTLRP
ncbi:MAG: hypothetical protein HY870_13995 [Chloroflexi bacterium]|nr:hypothetical protein [Chloroflexota bacterium]